MNTTIPRQQFDMRQPEHKNDSSSEDFFYNLANRLINAWQHHRLLSSWPIQIQTRTALGIVGYFQDILADTGIWRSFIDMHRRLYSKTLPFYEVSESYIDYELNPEDVRFVMWYTLALNSEDQRCHDPLDPEIKKAADLCFEILETEYDEAPEPESFKMVKGLEMNVPEEQEQIFHFGSWLFMYSYLMSPAYAMTMLEIMNDPVMQSRDVNAIQNRIEQSMMEDPTGPLALYLVEWLNLIIEGKYPASPLETEEISDTESKYYAPFIKATGGSQIAFFKDYKDLNNFFINSLGWDANEEHLPQLKNDNNFVLLISKHKGLLLAKNIARCIKHPENHLYDKDYAAQHAIDLLTVRKLCPADLLKFLHEGNFLPDARFPGNDNPYLVNENFDFIARCYLQLYYRGD